MKIGDTGYYWIYKGEKIFCCSQHETEYKKLLKVGLIEKGLEK